MLDEMSMRKPEFTSGVPVVLGDGQEWTFALPRLRLSPCITSDGTISVSVNRSGLPRYEHWVRVITGAVQLPIDEYWVVRMQAAATLLLANYAIAGDELAILL